MPSDRFLALRRFFRIPTHTPEMESCAPEPTCVVEVEVTFTKSTYSSMRSKDLISRAFREVYEYLDGGTELSGGESDTKWDEYGMPTSRTELHGTTGKGLFMWADPKVSGHGAHGESASWSFNGLPDNLKVTGEHHVDYRMPTSRLGMRAEGVDPRQAEWIKQHFALALRNAIGGKWHLTDGKWSQ